MFCFLSGLFFCRDVYYEDEEYMYKEGGRLGNDSYKADVGKRL